MAGRIELLRGVVHPWHHDAYGHMNVRHYAPFFDDASYHLWARAGVPMSTMHESHGVHTVAARTTTEFLRELRAGDLFVIDGVVRRLGGRSLTLLMRMCHAESGEVHATYETVEVFFDATTRRSTDMPEAIRSALTPFLEAAA